VKKGFYSFLLGMLLAPLVIFLHECGHYVVAAAYDANPEFHVGRVSYRSHQPTANQAYFWIAAGGPLVNVLLATTGFLWLRYKRHARIGTAPTRTDCLGIFLVCQIVPAWVVIFVVHLILQDFLTRPGDAEKMSLSMGLPVWLSPVLLASFSLVLIGAAMRLFPRGSRLVPFGYALVGWFTGCFMQSFCSVLWERRFNS